MVSRETSLGRYADLLLEANEETNLVSRKLSKEEVHDLVRVFAGTLEAVGHQPGERLLDIGTGAGLPGIPLAIRYPALHVVLSETRRRRVAAVLAFRERLGLENVTVLPGPVERHIGDLSGAFDVVTAFGVAPAAEMIGVAAPFLAPGGIALLSCPLRPSAEEEAVWLLEASIQACRALVRRDVLPGPRSLLQITRR